jgi:uncharacterized radical SAM superfamily Fe-S cluster-containing enzyme
MQIKEIQIMSKDQANLIIKNQGRFTGDICPECDRSVNHQVHTKDDAYWLVCICGEELREIDPEELK